MSIAFSDEHYRKISALVDSQFPGFIRENGPNFVAFLKAYYEYAEQNGNAIDTIRGLPDLHDVDRINSGFLKYITKDILANIPQSIVADRRLLAKYIRDIYAARGSEFSYRFLFRSLYNTEIDIVYPSEQILRASDGRWVQETIIRVAEPYTANPNLFSGKLITGQLSGAYGYVNNIIQRTINGLAVFELTLQNVVGNFQDGEVVGDGTNTATIFTGAGTLTGLGFAIGGAYHVIGDILAFSSSTASGTATVTSVSDESAITLKIQKGGGGFTLGNSVITFSGGNGSNANATVTALSNTVSSSINIDIIDYVKNVVLNTSGAGAGTFSGLGQNTHSLSSKLSSANIASTLSAGLYFWTGTTGSIDKVTLINSGYNYSTLPTATVSDTYISKFHTADTIRGGELGNNAVLVVNNAPGAITSARINTGGAAFIPGDPITITNITRGISTISNTNIDGESLTRTTFRQTTYDPSAQPIQAGALTAIIENPGKYIDTKGFLSWDNVLEDNYYYQQFSYVIKFSQSVEMYQDILKKLLHPAGTIIFGQRMINTTADIGVYLSANSSVTI
jgi:hypothetical protein